MDLDVSWNRLARSRKLRLVSWMRSVGSRASVAEAEIWLGKQPAYLAIAERWDGLDAPGRDAAWKELIALFRAAAYATRPFCLRCGTCCSNAGPTLYAGDEGLLSDGVVAPAHLMTYRRGEQVYSHWADRAEILEREMVMIAPAPGGGCAFLDRRERSCRIHARRPAQCRAQKCWDTADANKLMGWPSLSRLDLLDDDDPLRPLIAEHDEVCAPARLRMEADQARMGGGTDGLRALIERDRAIRKRVIDEGLAPSAALGFLLGRPLEAMLPPLGFQAVGDFGGSFAIRPARKGPVGAPGPRPPSGRS